MTSQKLQILTQYLKKIVFHTVALNANGPVACKWIQYNSTRTYQICLKS